MPWPMAWNREEQAMPKPAKIKLREMILRAGTPISSMESEALKIIRRFSAAKMCIRDSWYTDENLTIPWDLSKDTVTGPMTLYAKWRDK